MSEKRLCVNCDDELTGNNPRKKYCNQEKAAKCPVCGDEFSYICIQDRRMKHHCSKKCVDKNPKRMEKIRETTLKKYGVDNFFKDPEIHKRAVKKSMSKESKEKRKQTNLSRYGVENSMQSPEIAKRMFDNQRENNGGKLGFNTEKQKNTMMERYGVDVPCKNPEILRKSIDNNIAKNGKLFGAGGRVSKGNIFMANLLKERFDVNVKLEHRIENIFFDLFLPDHDIAIDINPTISHNSDISFACLRNRCEINCSKHKPMPQDAHYQRAQIAKNNNLSLIQVYDWDDIDEIIAIVGEKISNKEKILVQNCSIRAISQEELNEFLQVNHVQHELKKQENYYGALYNEKIISVAVFSLLTARNSKWIFDYYSEHKNFSVIGGEKELFDNFVNNISPKLVINYVNFDRHTGKEIFLNNLGFIEEETTGPNLVWHHAKNKNLHKVTKEMLNKIGTNITTNIKCDSISGEEENNKNAARHEKCVKVYTAGNRVFIWRKK